MTSLDKNLNAGNKRFSFASKAYPADKFSVVKMEGYEAISANFSFELTLVSDDVSIDFEKMLSNPATFTLYAAGGNMATPYHGVLSEFEQLHQSGDLVFYRAVLAPRLQRLNLYRTSDVHLNDQTIPEILEAVLKDSKDSGLSSADYEKKLKGSYRKRSFVCQYQETNLDFMTRWMEKEGMYFYFDHSGNTEKLVMLDDGALQPAGVVGVTYRPVENMASGAARDSVQNFVCRQKPLPRQVILPGFNYSSAAVELKQTAPVSDAGAGDVMLYGENFLTQEEGQRYAKLRAQEILCGGKVFKGEATAVGVRSGYFIRMTAHYRSDFNGQYLVTEVEHHGSQAGVLLAGIENSFGGKPGETDYHLEFKAIPSAVQFRPARSMIRPYVAGTVSAIVDAEGSGQYADMDALGQYKVQLPFSKTGKGANKGSARIRMATPYSGSNHGIHFPLHKGAEVLLSFIDGDPDQPVIVNAVPNSENPSMVSNKNPAESLITTAGGNQILMDDTKGKEVVYITSPYQNSALVIGNPEGRRSTVGKDGAKGDTGAAGAKGDTGAAGAKGDTGAAAPEPPKATYPGIWAATSGSSESVTAGVSNSLKLGYNNSASLSFDNSVAVSMSNKLAVGASAALSAGADISWKFGHSISIDDSDSISLKKDGKLQGNDKVTISGGQSTLIGGTMEKAKMVAKAAILLNLGANAAASTMAGLALSDSPLDDKGKLKVGDQSSSHLKARNIGIGMGIGGAVAVNALLFTVGRLLKLSTTEAVYKSNIELDSSGVNVTAKDIPSINQGSVKVTAGGAELFAGPAPLPVPALLPGAVAPPPLPPLPPYGSVDVQRTSVTTRLVTAPGVGSALVLRPLGAVLETTNPAGEISLTQPTGGSVKLAAAGLTATSGAAKLELKVAGGATLTGSPTAKLDISPTMLQAEASGSKFLMALNGCKLTSSTGGSVIVGARVAVTGLLIELG